MARTCSFTTALCPAAAAAVVPAFAQPATSMTVTARIDGGALRGVTTTPLPGRATTPASITYSASPTTASSSAPIRRSRSST